MACTAEQRARWLHRLNIAVLVLLGPYALLSPAGAAEHLFGDARAGKVAALQDMSPPSGGSPLFSYQMLGTWWVAVALVSALGLGDPLKFSPVFLVQAGYKLVFLFTVIVPMLLKGRGAAFPLVPTVFFEGFLVPLFALTPWRYLMGSSATAGTNGDKWAAAKAE
ncbi:potassium transporter [Chlorella sorokiniana]|uniref:Potassium transporter n=1 Tax=Chlorella sorokiniana TaxID=3076 RepID=A0A2P6TLB2_CHLSO|nr:potassium transporter [Chlorella sorokiniana]|eukprot:PRW45082.1 potassium transporter [Chlorella sorokiniana]